MKYPDCYLHVREERSGEEWIVPIGEDEVLDLEWHIASWVSKEFGGELRVDWPLMPKLSGEYYARIMTDGRSPDSVVCWEGGGFFLKGGVA